MTSWTYATRYDSAWVFKPRTVLPVYDVQGNLASTYFAENGLTSWLEHEPTLGSNVSMDSPASGIQLSYRGVLPTTNAFGTLLFGKRDDAGTLYSRNRAYDPLTGRFTQEDPIGLGGGVNLYAYAGGDPVNYNDPYGLFATGITSSDPVNCGTDWSWCYGDEGGGSDTTQDSGTPGNAGRGDAGKSQTCAQAAAATITAGIEDIMWLNGAKEVQLSGKAAKKLARLAVHWITDASPGTTGTDFAKYFGFMGLHQLEGNSPIGWDGWGQFFIDNTPLLNTLNKLEREYQVCSGSMQ